GLNIDQPLTMEDEINKITGVLENGIFARDAADVLILGTEEGAKVIYPCQG
ncbi:ribose-5-phosphate isomerase A, partial [Neisseria gonorrhoeae]